MTHENTPAPLLHIRPSVRRPPGHPGGRQFRPRSRRLGAVRRGGLAMRFTFAPAGGHARSPALLQTRCLGGREVDRHRAPCVRATGKFPLMRERIGAEVGARRNKPRTVSSGEPDSERGGSRRGRAFVFTSTRFTSTAIRRSEVSGARRRPYGLPSAVRVRERACVRLQRAGRSW